jgi:formylglycine-generating enzyme required for sulfatase activity
MVSWYDAKEFCRILSEKTGKMFNLPSEAEWEYACRAGTSTRFSFGDDDSELFEYGNFCDASNTSGLTWQDKRNNDNYDKTAPVGSYRKNAFGLYDMHGNVWEWCEDKWHRDYNGAPADGSAWISGNASSRVFRGGSWGIGARNCRSAFREKNEEAFRYYYLGFRVCAGQ